MAKRKKNIIAGRIRKTVIYTAPEPADSRRTRAEKSRMTSAARKAMNDKTARNRLEMLIACNFSGRDLFVTLTYCDTDLPAKRAAAVQLCRSFLTKLRKVRAKRGLTLKYIYTTEEKHGEARLHHHLIINGTGRDIEDLRSLWTYGDDINIEYIGEREYDIWAAYMTKEGIQGRPVGARLWTASNNTEKPIVQTEYVSNNTSLAVPPGCHVIEREEKVSEFGSYCYIKYKVPME